MTETLRVGTRGSALALLQSRIVIDALARRARHRRFELVVIRTAGDRARRSSEGLDFTGEIDEALEGGRVDLAVHSAKDLPARGSPAVRLAAFLRRADPRDALVASSGGRLSSLGPGARIGTSSARRRAQLRRARPDVEVVEIRGNVDTRLELVHAGRVDGVVLAAAGLERLGRSAEISELLDRRRFVPAPGQGAIAVAVRAADRAGARLVAAIDHPPTRAAVTAERSFVDGFGGDCDAPIGASAVTRGERISLRAEILSPDGRRSVSGEGTGSSATAVGKALARRLARSGADALLAPRSSR